MATCLVCRADLVEDFTFYLREVKGLRPASRTSYVRWVDRFLDEVGGPDAYPLSTVDRVVIRDYVTAASDRFSPWTVKLIATSLRAFFRFAFVSSALSEDLVEAVGTVVTRRHAKIPQALEKEEVERLLASPDRGVVAGARDYAMMLLLTRLGLRVSEVAGLELEDFWWREGVVSVSVKGGGRTTLPLTQEIIEAVVDYLRLRPKCQFQAVFLSAKGVLRPITGPVVTAVVKRHSDRVGLRSVHAHRLRHTLARQVLEGGGTLAEVNQLLGHNDMQTTMVYSSLDINKLRPLAAVWPMTVTI